MVTNMLELTFPQGLQSNLTGEGRNF